MNVPSFAAWKNSWRHEIGQFEYLSKKRLRSFGLSRLNIIAIMHYLEPDLMRRSYEMGSEIGDNCEYV